MIIPKINLDDAKLKCLELAIDFNRNRNDDKSANQLISDADTIFKFVFDDEPIQIMCKDGIQD